MLFDLRGKRRRAVQATYLMLALLMGGGLVLFGIGGEVSGGLVDAFKGGGGGDTNQAVEENIDKQEQRLRANPQNAALLESLTRSYYQLGTQKIPDGATELPDDARADLRKAAAYWERYVESDVRPETSVASFAVQLYGQQLLNQPGKAQRAALIVAERTDDPAAYLQVVQFATLAGDKRTANLAATKAVDLAPKDQRKAVKQQAEALKQPPQTQAPSG